MNGTVHAPHSSSLTLPTGTKQRQEEGEREFFSAFLFLKIITTARTARSAEYEYLEFDAKLKPWGGSIGGNGGGEKVCLASSGRQCLDPPW
jgi:hypothetical protein